MGKTFVGAAKAPAAAASSKKPSGKNKKNGDKDEGGKKRPHWNSPSDPDSSDSESSDEEEGGGNGNDDGYMDECYICDDGGDLICCDGPGCDKAYHADCVKVDINTLPLEWLCPICVTKEKRKKAATAKERRKSAVALAKGGKAKAKAKGAPVKAAVTMKAKAEALADSATNAASISGISSSSSTNVPEEAAAATKPAGDDVSKKAASDAAAAVSEDPNNSGGGANKSKSGDPNKNKTVSTPMVFDLTESFDDEEEEKRSDPAGGEASASASSNNNKPAARSEYSFDLQAAAPTEKKSATVANDVGISKTKTSANQQAASTKEPASTSTPENDTESAKKDSLVPIAAAVSTEAAPGKTTGKKVGGSGGETSTEALVEGQKKPGGSEQSQMTNVAPSAPDKTIDASSSQPGGVAEKESPKEAPAGNKDNTSSSTEKESQKETTAGNKDNTSSSTEELDATDPKPTQKESVLQNDDREITSAEKDTGNTADASTNHIDKSPQPATDSPSSQIQNINTSPDVVMMDAACTLENFHPAPDPFRTYTYKKSADGANSQLEVTHVTHATKSCPVPHCPNYGKVCFEHGNKRKTCDVPHCPKTRVLGGMCVFHAKRQPKQKPAKEKQVKEKFCEREGCYNKVAKRYNQAVRRFCNNHILQSPRKSTLEEPTTPSPAPALAPHTRTYQTVIVPQGVEPGDLFQVILGRGKVMDVNCPKGVSPGDKLIILEPGNYEPPISAAKIAEMNAQKLLQGFNKQEQPFILNAFWKKIWPALHSEGWSYQRQTHYNFGATTFYTPNISENIDKSQLVLNVHYFETIRGVTTLIAKIPRYNKMLIEIRVDIEMLKAEAVLQKKREVERQEKLKAEVGSQNNLFVYIFWKNIWPALHSAGWSFKRQIHNDSQVTTFYQPKANANMDKSQLVLNVHYFETVDGVVKFIAKIPSYKNMIAEIRLELEELQSEVALQRICGVKEKEHLKREAVLQRKRVIELQQRKYMEEEKSKSSGDAAVVETLGTKKRKEDTTATQGTRKRKTRTSVLLEEVVDLDAWKCMGSRERIGVGSEYQVRTLPMAGSCEAGEGETHIQEKVFSDPTFSPSTITPAEWYDWAKDPTFAGKFEESIVECKKEMHLLAKALDKPLGFCLFYYYHKYKIPKNADNYQSLKKMIKLKEKENSDECAICQKGGDLLCCDTCPDSYHLSCLSLSFVDVESMDKWSCPNCIRKRKLMRSPPTSPKKRYKDASDDSYTENDNDNMIE